MQMSDEEIVRELTETGSRARSNTHRIDEVEAQLREQTDLVKSVAVMANELSNMKGDMQEIKRVVRGLADKPARRWEAVVDKAVTALVGGLVAYLLFTIGLGG
jgi:hypothetical protein